MEVGGGLPGNFGSYLISFIWKIALTCRNERVFLHFSLRFKFPIMQIFNSFSGFFTAFFLAIIIYCRFRDNVLKVRFNVVHTKKFLFILIL